MKIFSRPLRGTISLKRIRDNIRGVRRRPLLQDRLNRALHELGVPDARIIIRADDDLGGTHRVRLAKSGATTRACLFYRGLWHEGLLRAMSHRLPVMISFFLAARQVDEAVVEVSDGSDGGPGIVGFDARNQDPILVVDPEFYFSKGYQLFRQAAVGAPDWGARSDTIVWRGSTTGWGTISGDPMDHKDILQRTRMCLALRDLPGVDARFSDVSQSADIVGDRARLSAAGLLGERIDAKAWRDMKFALVVDGNASPWSAFYTRLLLGCCVIRVTSRFGYRQWYHADLRPWEHVVPVAADLSDLVEKIDWCRSHPAECRQIAARGQEFATRRTFETEVRASIEAIEAALGPR